MKGSPISVKRRWIIALTVFAGCLVVIVLGVCLMTGGAAKKRGPPPKVPPVLIAGIEYRAPNTYDTEGCIEAWDIKSKKILWRKKVYFTMKIPLSEEDNQWTFIKSMAAGPSGKELIIVNEAGNRYAVTTTPSSRLVTVAIIATALLLFAIAFVVFARR
jgi:hypothetical protein